MNNVKNDLFTMLSKSIINGTLYKKPDTNYTMHNFGKELDLNLLLLRQQENVPKEPTVTIEVGLSYHHR